MKYTIILKNDYWKKYYIVLWNTTTFQAVKKIFAESFYLSTDQTLSKISNLSDDTSAEADRSLSE